MLLQNKLFSRDLWQQNSPSIQFLHDTYHLIANLLLLFIGGFPNREFIESLSIDLFDQYEIYILVLIQLTIWKFESIPAVTFWNHLFTIFQRQIIGRFIFKHVLNKFRSTF